jgi:hypothetical protein
LSPIAQDAEKGCHSMTTPKVCYHTNGTATLKSDPKTIVATWKKSKDGGWDVFAYPDGEARGIGINASPRHKADPYIIGWAEVANAVRTPPKDDKVNAENGVEVLQLITNLLLTSKGKATLTGTYRNWRGVSGKRRLVPEAVWYGSTDWHPEPGHMLRAFDVDKGAARDFCLADFEIKTLRLD